MSEAPKGLTLDNTTRASNPGNLQVRRLQWLRHYPKWPLIWFGSLAFFVVMTCVAHPSFWVGALLLLLLNWFYWQRVGDHFRHGCANPAIVVSLDPMLIAVTTDLSKGIGEYPVVKIIEKTLPTIGGQVPQLGSRLPTVALYEASPDENVPHWADFDPRPVACATSDPGEIQSVLNTFEADHWSELNTRLSQVPRPFQAGLFHMPPHA